MLERFEKFSIELFSLHKTWHKIASYILSAHGLSSSHLCYLLALLQNKDGLTSSELIEICGKDKSDVSRSLNLMIKKGIVEKKSFHKRGYGGVFFLTPIGLTVASHTYDRVSSAVRYATKNIPQEKRDVFFEVLEMFAENLIEINDKNTCKEGE